MRPNTPLVREALDRLAAAGAGWAPRFLGIEDGEEVLSWLDGEVAASGADVDLDALARLVRELHDVTGLLHDDLQPRNLLVAGGRPVGLVDWEQVRPGPRIEDVAGLCWSFTEPYDGCDPAAVGRRWREVLVAYGTDALDPAALVPTMLERMARCAADIEREAAAGSARHRVLLDRGDAAGIRAARDWVSANRAVLDAAVLSGA